MRILIIDDEKTIRTATALAVNGDGGIGITAESGRAGLSKLQSESFDLVLLDLRMPGENGLEIIPQIHRLKPDLPVIVFTAYASEETSRAALASGAADYLAKPFTPEQLRGAIRRVVDGRNAPDLTVLPAATDSALACVSLGAPVSLAQIERAHIERVLNSTRTLEEAARILEIDPATLYRKRKRWEVDSHA